MEITSKNYLSLSKTLDKVRPGGIIAFVTSRGTMDKKNDTVRRYIAERAELIGAIRLPNNTFSDTGTNVTTDILFLKKHETLKPLINPPEWIGLEESGMYNAYFSKHPEMVLGRLVCEFGQYGKIVTCKPFEGKMLGDLLNEAVQKLNGHIGEYVQEISDESVIPSNADVKNFSYTVVDDNVYFREDSIMLKVNVKSDLGRLKGLIKLRTAMNKVIQTQAENCTDDEIQKAQATLNDVYDKFIEKYGYISSQVNRKVFSKDSSYYLLCSLEQNDGEGNFQGKAAIFTKRTIRNHVPPEHADTPVDAIAVSLNKNGCVDMADMCRLCRLSPEEMSKDLSGLIFKNPNSPADDIYTGWESADEYLSGNVRKKLKEAREAAQKDDFFAGNVEYLEKVQLKNIEAADIDVRLGVIWIPESDIKEFIFDILKPNGITRNYFSVEYLEHSGTWKLYNWRNDWNNEIANSRYGTERVSAYEILEKTLNLQEVKVTSKAVNSDGTAKLGIDVKETIKAKEKQRLIKEKFKEWVFAEPKRRNRLCELYNERFNSIKPRNYDGSHLVIPGMNPEIELMPHQRNAIARGLYGKNMLIAHCVGAGKTLTFGTVAVEKKRLGMCQKTLMVVPNHLTEQIGKEIQRAFPSANILVASKKDFLPSNRKKFCCRIATGDQDIAIIGHTQFERIPVSKERQELSIQAQIEDFTLRLSSLKSNKGSRFRIREIETSKKVLESRLKELLNIKKDDVIEFEQIGIDNLVVDEAHYYKNAFIHTKMGNVSGISTTESKKCSDMMLKCSYIDEITGGKGIVFSTGTPISNSITELYIMQRYLQKELLEEYGLNHFDSWASTFGETTTSLELSPEGGSFRSRLSFNRFYNIPELMSIFREVADIQTADMLDLPVPMLKGGKIETIVCKPSEYQVKLVEELGKRADKVRHTKVDPKEDNLLKITSDGRMLALDERLINPLLRDNPSSKVNACVKNVFDIYQSGKEQRTTQLIFSDLSTPNSDGSFSIYNDIKSKLVEMGVVKEEILFIHDAKTDAQKDELFKNVREGKVRILIGSTVKCGAGTNIQDQLIALHNLDCPWRPSDLEQRHGRILRQGNKNSEVGIYSYVTEGTFDAYCWGLVERKQKFIGQIMTNKIPLRGVEDLDNTSLSYAEIKALATGNPLIKEKLNLDIEIAQLEMLRCENLNQKYAMQNKLLMQYPKSIEQMEQTIEGLKSDLKSLEKYSGNKFEITLEDVVYNDKAAAGKKLLELVRNCKPGMCGMRVGAYKGLRLIVDVNLTKASLILRGKRDYSIDLGESDIGNMTRMDNRTSNIGGEITEQEMKIEDIKKQMENVIQMINKPFEREEELIKKRKEVEEINIELGINQKEEIDESTEEAVMPQEQNKAQHPEPEM